MEGKHIANTLFKGSLVRLSAKGAEVRSENGERQGVPSGLSNIKLNLLTPNKQAVASEDIYAKVLEKTTGNGSFYIHLTAQPPDVAAKLNSLYKLMKWASTKREDSG